MGLKISLDGTVCTESLLSEKEEQEEQSLPHQAHLQVVQGEEESVFKIPDIFPWQGSVGHEKELRVVRDVVTLHIHVEIPSNKYWDTPVISPGTAIIIISWLCF